MKEVSYKVGDVVQLRSGSPELKVINLENGYATVEWFDDDGVLSNWTFPAGCFEMTEQSKNESVSCSKTTSS